MSRALVEMLGPSTSKHLKPYRIEWIKMRAKVKVQELCKIPFSIGIHYKDEATCDVVDIDACHTLLGMPLYLFD